MAVEGGGTRLSDAPSIWRSRRCIRAVLARLSDAADVLFLAMHHLIIDAYALLSRSCARAPALYELEAARRAIRCTDATAPALSVLRFRALSSRGRLPPPGHDPGLREFWKTQLGDLVPLEMPMDRTPPGIASHRGEFLTFSIAARSASRLQQLAATEGTTLFAVLVTAFKVLLYRYTGQQDIGIRTIDAGRTLPEHETLLGCCASSFILRTALDGDLSFLELLRRVHETLTSVLEHRAFPFREMLEILSQRTGLQRPPVPLAFILEPRMPDSARGWSVSQHDVQTGTAKFDLTFEVEERESGLIGRVEYATDLFDRERIARMVEHWRTLLEAIVSDPKQQIGRLPLLTAAEREQLLVQWNDSAVDYPRDRCIHQLFEQQVARTPDATAVVFEDTRLSYAELNARANRLAHHLITLGVGPDTLVGLCLERSLELVVGLLGILKAGGAYVPLDPSYPAPRLAFMLEDTRAPVLLTQHQLLGQLPPYAGRVLCLDRDLSLLAAQPDTDPPCRATAREPRLRHLHLRLHRQSQGRDDRARQRRAPVLGDAALVWLRRA